MHIEYFDYTDNNSMFIQYLSQFSIQIAPTLHPVHSQLPVLTRPCALWTMLWAAGRAAGRQRRAGGDGLRAAAGRGEVHHGLAEVKESLPMPTRMASIRW